MDVVVFVNQPICYDSSTGEYSSDYMNLIDFLLELSGEFKTLSLCLPVKDGPGKTPLDLPDNVEILHLPHYNGPEDLIRTLPKIIPELVRKSRSKAVKNADLVGMVAPSTLSVIPIVGTHHIDRKPHFLIMRGDKRKTVAGHTKGDLLKGAVYKSVIRTYDRFFSNITRRDNAVLLTIGDLKQAISEYGYRAEDAHVFRPLIPERIILDQPRRTGKSATDVLYVGRLSGEKGVDTLIEAFATVVKHEPDSQLQIVGSGPARQELQRLAQELGIAESVHFHGFVPKGPQLWERYDAADIFVLPSRTEGLPRVVGEAMARGLPIVTTAVGGLPELIDHNENGVLVEPRTADQLAQELIAVQTNDELRTRIAEGGLKTATGLTFSAAAGRLRTVVERELLESRSPLE